MKKARVYKDLAIAWGLATLLILIASLTMAGNFQPPTVTYLAGFAIAMIFTGLGLKWHLREHLLDAAIPGCRKTPLQIGSPAWIAALQPVADKAIVVAENLVRRRQAELQNEISTPNRSALDLDCAEYCLYMAQLDEKRFKRALRGFGFKVPALMLLALPRCGATSLNKA